MDEEEYPYPAPGMKVFSVGLGYEGRYNARVNYSTYPWSLYAEGYRKAADQLVVHACLDRAHLNHLIYPITYLYRHYLELRMKESLLTVGVTYGANHSLRDLWDSTRKVAEKIWPDGDPAVLDAVESCIDEFVQWDERSTNFRYPVQRGNVPSIALHVELISVFNMGQTMQAIGNFFDGLTMGLTELTEQQGT